MLALAAAASAQTFVVDASNGPGTNFTEIATAVATVASGATLWVRPGLYLPFTIAGKAMAVLADPGVFVAGSAVVSNTQSSQSVILRGLDFTTPTFGVGAVIHAYDCHGLVLLAELTTPPAPAPEPIVASYWITPRGLVAQRCDQLLLRDCTIASAVLSECVSVVESCVLRGTDQQPTGGLPANAVDGLTIGEGRCDVVGNTQLIGGAAYPGSAQPPGLKAILTDARVHSGRIEAGGGGPGWAVSSASSQLSIDPSVVFVSGVFPAIIGAASIVAMPELVSTGAPPGGSMQATVATASGDLVALFAAAVGLPTSVPDLPGVYWLDPATVVLLAAGVQQVGFPIGGVVVVPNLAQLRGATIAWQALSFGAAGLGATNPSIATVQ